LLAFAVSDTELVANVANAAVEHAIDAAEVKKTMSLLTQKKMKMKTEGCHRINNFRNTLI